MEETGAKTCTASEAEMRRVVEEHAHNSAQAQGALANASANLRENEDFLLHDEKLPWSHEEELLVVRPMRIQASSSRSSLAMVLRSLFLFAALASATFGLVRTVQLALHGEEGA